MAHSGSLTDEEQDQVFAKAVVLARERAKANALSNAFDAGFEAAMAFYASEEFERASQDV